MKMKAERITGCPDSGRGETLGQQESLLELNWRDEGGGWKQSPCGTTFPLSEPYAQLAARHLGGGQGFGGGTIGRMFLYATLVSLAVGAEVSSLHLFTSLYSSPRQPRPLTSL